MKVIVRKTLKTNKNKNDNQALKIIRDNPGTTIQGEFTEH